MHRIAIPAGQAEFTLPYQQPYGWAAIVQSLRAGESGRGASPAGRYERSIAWQGGAGTISVTPAPSDRSTLIATIRLSSASTLSSIAARTGDGTPPAKPATPGLELVFPSPAAPANADCAHSLGMPCARAAAMLTVARAAIIDAQLFEPGAGLDNAIARLTVAVHYIAMRGLTRSRCAARRRHCPAPRTRHQRCPPYCRRIA
ncbi:MAG: hypothetical protein HIU90_14570 [Proteobacteria bacterium]|nr:hypothetical protein [Pseudomonadota bacterium]